MNKKVIANQLQAIFIDHFHISIEQFDWETPLEVLQKDFKVLSYLVDLEQLLQQQFKKKILIIENISTIIHTPNDVLNLIIKEL